METTSETTQGIPPTEPSSGTGIGPTRNAVLLRLEGLLVLGGATWMYQMVGGSWLFFALLFLVPDVFMLGYARGKTTGAVVYNLGHTYLTPAALALWALTATSAAGLQIALIWVSHIAFDRVLGYGLKNATGFKNTHLQRA